MIDYLADLYVKALILLSCCAWAALVFWGIIYVTEKILRWVYQDAPSQLLTSEVGSPAECIDCGGTHMLDAAGRCDLCVSIELASIAHYGYATSPGEAWDDHDYEDIVDGYGRLIKRVRR